MRRKESGQTLPLMGVLLVILVGFIAMGVDLGQGYLERRVNQNAADAAAIAGEKAMLTGVTSSSVANAIQNVIVANGYTASSLVFLSATQTTPGTDLSKVYVDAEYGAYASGSNRCTPLTGNQYIKWNNGPPPGGASCVRVVVTTSKRTFFANVPILGIPQIGANAASSAGLISNNGCGQALTLGVTGASWSSASGGTVTLSFATTANPPSPSSTISVSGVGQPGYNGAYTVVTSSSTNLTYSSSTNPGSYTGSGTITYAACSQNVTPSPTPTTPPWDTGTGLGYAVWGGPRADNSQLSVNSTVLYYADTHWNTGSDVQTGCKPCAYDATQNFKGLADPQCFSGSMNTSCSAPDGAHGNPPSTIPVGSYIQVVVVDSITHQGNDNVMSRIGLITIQTLASCPTSPSYLQTATGGYCGVITYIDSGQLNEGTGPTPTPIPSATPTATPVIGNTN